LSNREEVRAQWSAEKRQKIDTLESQHKKILENIYGTLMRRNNLAAKPESVTSINSQVQALVTSSDLAALIDALEGMGKLDRVDYMNRCVERFAKMAQIIERAQ
jgi:hypothetical protein